jgi:hypothetical protein
VTPFDVFRDPHPESAHQAEHFPRAEKVCGYREATFTHIPFVVEGKDALESLRARYTTLIFDHDFDLATHDVPMLQRANSFTQPRSGWPAIGIGEREYPSSSHFGCGVSCWPGAFGHGDNQAGTFTDDAGNLFRPARRSIIRYNHLEAAGTRLALEIVQAKIEPRQVVIMWNNHADLRRVQDCRS